VTCIVGLIHDGKVWLGGDRAAVGDGHYLTHSAHPKVFRRGSAVIGYTSSFRMGQLLQYRLAIPKRHADRPLDEFMATDFAEAVRECLKEGGYTKFKDCREEVGQFLIGIEGQLYFFDDDHHARRPICGFDACGSGVSVALGSLHTSRQTDMSPRDRLLRALEAASVFVTSVGGPFDIIVEGDDRIFTATGSAAA
jgi:hypothetical protein